MKTRLIPACAAILLAAWRLPAQSLPPGDLWTPQTLAQIRDRSTLELQIAPKILFSEITFTSNPAASWFDAAEPYAEHTNEKIRIHGFIASPVAGAGPFPALVLGHGHGGSADSSTAVLLAALGYTVLTISSPGQGQSTGPKDTNQGWISIDRGAHYGYLYHNAYAGMRALTALEELAARPGNPFRIDPARLGVLGASMGGIFTTTINGLDDRVKAAIVMASAGNWAHTLRYPNSWLYFGIYTGTRDRPYNGADPLNSIEDIDRDPTAIGFMNYFDPIRYCTRQYAPVLTVIGTHDEYFPLPNANLQLQAIASAGARANFEKRLWLIPNGPHGFDAAIGQLELSAGLKQWLDYAFGARADKPLPTPAVAMSDAGGGALRFEISTGETAARLAGASASLWAAMRVDSTAMPTLPNDFQAFPAALQGDRFVAQIPAGARTPSGDAITQAGVIYFATVRDRLGLSVSSLAYKGALPMDLSTDFTPAIEPFSRTAPAVPLPPAAPEASTAVAGSLPVPADRAYQGMALTNPTGQPAAVRVEARTPDGRIAAAEGLVNPAYMSLPPRSQQVFLAEERLGPGARNFNGSFRAVFTDPGTSTLAFRGNVGPPELDGIGPLPAPDTALWLPLAPEQDTAAARTIRIFGGAAAAAVTVTFRGAGGDVAQQVVRQVQVPAAGTADLVPPQVDGQPAASAEVRSTAPVSARLEVSRARDTWSVDAQALPASPRYALPHAEWNGTYTTRILAVNPGDNGRVLQVRLRTRDGQLVAANPALIFVLPYGTASRTLESLFPAATGAGWVEMEAQGGPVVVTALAVDSRGGAAGASPVGPGTAGVFSMPYFVQNDGYWTGLALANPGESAVDVTIVSYDAAGMETGRSTVTLQPGTSQTQLLFQWITGLPVTSSGHIVITAAGAVARLSYYGTTDFLSMAAI